MLVVLFPILGVLSAWFGGRFLGRVGSAFLTTFCIFAAWLAAVTYMFNTLQGDTSSYLLNSWFVSDLAVAPWGFYFDSVTAVLFVVILSVSCIVHLYSIAYMQADPSMPRFFSYLSLFTFLMLILVSGDNFVVLFVGW
jgi:NADH:ubiquinone oxidoreductase subunit 5 (subunit L)/multisubunit Na+/H+ antiporter MnhA subunit